MHQLYCSSDFFYCELDAKGPEKVTFFGLQLPEHPGCIAIPMHLFQVFCIEAHQGNKGQNPVPAHIMQLA